MDERHNWARLNPLQIGKYAEYLAKMEFVLHGCDVFSSEVDDCGIDFVVRTHAGNHYDVQVKSFRVSKNNYVFLKKSKFTISSQSMLALVRFALGEPPNLYLVPSCVDGAPNPIFESRDFGEGRKSEPEWGLTVSKRKLELLTSQYGFGASVTRLP